MRWLFIGGGNMASSLIGGLIASGADVASIAAVDPNDTTRELVASRFDITTAASLDALIASSPAWCDAGDGKLGIVIAVKPNIARAVCEALAGMSFLGTPAVLSVAAGVRCSSLQSWLGDSNRWSVMRCMPNTPALIGKGASALFAGNATPEQRDAALNMLDAVGMAVTVHSESDIDAVTALSGSGPAYVFRLAELMIENGVALGLEPDQATRLAIGTLEGAAAMLTHSQDDAATLRRNVTSPGGTTAAALERFAQSGLDACIRDGMIAARDRAQELGQEMDQAPTSHS